MKLCAFKQITLAASAALAAAVLSGCIAAPLIVGGAAATTASVATDRRTAGSIVSDEVTEKRIAYDIEQAFKNRKHHVSVTAYDGRVLLSGEVTTLVDRRAAEQIASVSPDVKDVVNELAVMEPSSLSTRLSDALLATKVRTAIITDSRISLNQMKVTVERGIVYLMGFVTVEEAQTAARTAAKVSGVQKVVTCFTTASREAIERRMKSMQGGQTTTP